jgi:hypothetical protein
MNRFENFKKAIDAVYADSAQGNWSPYKLSHPLFVVWAVEKAQGITDNGSFQYFFENDWPDNPPYSIFIDALREIGAQEAADCLQKAVDDFPFSNPHLDCEKRRKHLEKSRSAADEDDSIIDRLGDYMMGLSDDTYAKLERYIKQHQKYFPKLSS